MTEVKYSNNEIETFSDFHKKKHRDTCCIAPKIKYHEDKFVFSPVFDDTETVSYTHLTLPTTLHECRSRWSPYH